MPGIQQFFSPGRRQRFWRVVRFAWVGVVTSAAYMALALGLDHLLPWPLLVTNTMAYGLAFFISYFGQKHWTFNCDAGHAQSLLKFGTVSFCGFVINSITLAALTSLGVQHMLSLFVAVAVVSAFTYVMHRRWVFAPQQADQDA